MTYLKYQHFNFRADRLALIEKINTMIERYAAKGIYDLSVRQIYYQLVSADEFENSLSNYNKIGNIISDGRMAGLISWDSIVDRNRTLYGTRTWDNMMSALKTMRAKYKLNLWEDQDWYPVCGVEKAALEGVVGSICSELRIDYIAFRGYSSQSQSWSLGQRFAAAYKRGQRPILFYLHDHDPSGLDMIRDHRERMSLFCGAQVMVQPLALNMTQIQEHNPPPNVAKESDSRFADYQQKYGDESWELDALDPLLIQKLISDAVLMIRDEDKWDANLAREVDDLRAIDDMIAEQGGTTDEDQTDDE